jgi:hypothetical protein
MFIYELLYEGVIDTDVRADQVVLFTQHYMDRLHNRPGHIAIAPSDAEKVIRKLPKIRKYINRIELGQQFWVIDHTYNISLGLRRCSDDRSGLMKNIIGTVVTPTKDGGPGRPNGDLKPIINMP